VIIMRHHNHRGVVAATLAAALLLTTAAQAKTKRKKPARAPQACTAAYKDALMLAGDGALQAARAKLQMCARPSCGSVQRRCALGLQRVESDLPTIVAVAADEAGRSISETTVTVDGKPLVTRVDGRSVTVDPGPHEFTFETAGTPPVTVKAVVPMGRRNQPIAAVLRVPDGNPPPHEEPPPRPAPPPPVVVPPIVKPPVPEEPPPVARALRAPREPEPRSRSSVAPTLLTVVGVAGLAGGGVLTYWGRKDNQQLATCTPNCPPETVHHIRMLYLGADMSFVVGGLALGTATLLWMTSGPPAREERVASSSFGISPTRAGAVASYGRTF
jgi:hypothetical protein